MCGMNILIIKGSPRKNGMGDYFLGQVTEYLKDKDCTVDIFDQSHSQISRYDADMDACEKGPTLFEQKLMKADGIILLCPVYLKQMPGALKIEFDNVSYRMHEFPLIRKKVIIFNYASTHGAKELSEYFCELFKSFGAEVIGSHEHYTMSSDNDYDLDCLFSQIDTMMKRIEDNVCTFTIRQEKLFTYVKRLVLTEMKHNVITNKQERWKEFLPYDSLAQYIKEHDLK
jgi:NAD(P)H-dependent FMN reductase